ncbi:MAG: hypothetical protein M1834_005803 [Cirrosporium novae-zelandiae]|nr:MAG: hypothetical protein M1834_005803 [Cirrosporium novae-zelandiae]
MSSQLSKDPPTHTVDSLPKVSTFTDNLPADPQFPTPQDSHRAPRQAFHPRIVKEALFTYIRPDESQAEEYEVISVSKMAMRDLGLKEGEEKTKEFGDMVAGQKIFWDAEKEEGVYPWAQCYGGWQFGQWAGQLGDGRAISLFETPSPTTGIRWEFQLKGAGRTPYSRFADGKAVVRSSIREYIISEALHGLHIPTTRALSLTLLPTTDAVRERIEPCAIVSRFAPSWLRIGTFDLLRTRGDRANIRNLATYFAEHVVPGSWVALPAALPADTSSFPTAAKDVPTGIPKDEIQTPPGAPDTSMDENRFVRLYRYIVRQNAVTVAYWQAYGFLNGVLNTDNTSLLGLSLDFGPFAFMDDFDPDYTPNHDDWSLRYSYKNQPSIIWWNLVRLGEAMGELLGAGDLIDTPTFLKSDILPSDDGTSAITTRALTTITRAQSEFKSLFLSQYTTLMTLRLGLKTQHPSDFDTLFTPLLDMLESLSLDFNHFFRHLSNLSLLDLTTPDLRTSAASHFFHAEGVPRDEAAARECIATWLATWRDRVIQDWDLETQPENDGERQAAMRGVNPKFLPRGWVLKEVIERVEKNGERDVLGWVMRALERPFEERWDDWGGDGEGEGDDGGEAHRQRWCGDVPKIERGGHCSCSS